MSKILHKRRSNKNNKASKMIVVYDIEKYKALQELAMKESTTVSAILNNLYEHFLVVVDGPQTTIDMYDMDAEIPNIDADVRVWKQYLNSLDRYTYRDFDKKLMVILEHHNKRFATL